MTSRIPDSIDWKIQQSRIEGFFGNRIKNKSDIEDITQDVLLQAIDKIDAFDHEGIPDEGINDHFSRWLFGIARYKHMEYLKSQTSRKSRIEEMGEIGCEEIEAFATSPIDRLDAIEMAEGMKAILDSLSPAIREFATYYFGGFSTEEIADRLGIELASVHARASRLRKKIARYIDQSGIGKAQLEQILISITEPSEWENEFAVKEIMPWGGGGRYNWKQFVRYINSCDRIPTKTADTLNQARRQAERIEGDRSDMDYIIDQIGALTMEIQRITPNPKLLRKYANRIRHVSTIIADIIDPICGG